MNDKTVRHHGYTKANLHIRDLCVVEKNSFADTEDTRGTEVCVPSAILAFSRQLLLNTSKNSQNHN